MNIVQLGQTGGPSWWTAVAVGVPSTIVTVILAYAFRKFWMPERRRKYRSKFLIARFFKKNESLI
jgi:hypothetical protein